MKKLIIPVMLAALYVSSLSWSSYMGLPTEKEQKAIDAAEKHLVFPAQKIYNHLDKMKKAILDKIEEEEIEKKLKKDLENLETLKKEKLSKEEKKRYDFLKLTINKLKDYKKIRRKIDERLSEIDKYVEKEEKFKRNRTLGQATFYNKTLKQATKLTIKQYRKEYPSYNKLNKKFTNAIKKIKKQAKEIDDKYDLLAKNLKIEHEFRKKDPIGRIELFQKTFLE